MSLRKRIAFTAVLLCLPVAALALVEGTASLAAFVRAYLGTRQAEQSHTERDTLLGWINLPNVDRPDFYAPGAGFRTNSQRFRHRGELLPRPPAGRRRVVCSGDSFALGYGVDDARTWCAQLTALDPSLETVNMGQGGYGIDQAYLWYLRDGLSLRADLHVFSFISSDFYRMQTRQFSGYPKPRLVREGDSVRVIGVPVPRPGFGPLRFRLNRSVRTLRSFELIERLFGAGPQPAEASRTAAAAVADSTTWEVTRAALRDLARRDSANGTALVVVFLPRLLDYAGKEVDKWRRWLHAAVGRGEFQALDLIEPFRRLPPDSAAAMFIGPGESPFRGAAGHYNNAGNAWVAQQLVPLLGQSTGRPRD